MSGRRQLTAEDFAARFQRAFRTLWCVAAGVLGRAEGAEDVVQDAALTAFGRLDAFDPDTDFVAWMARIVRFTAMNRRRRHREEALVDPDGRLREPVAPDGAPPVPVAGDGTIGSDQQAFDDEVLQGLRELSAAQRTCLLLKAVRGLEYAEIARALGMPEGTAMSHVHRARRRLAQRLAARSGGAR